jgi:hypothetical protein
MHPAILLSLVLAAPGSSEPIRITTNRWTITWVSSTEKDQPTIKLERKPTADDEEDMSRELRRRIALTAEQRKALPPLPLNLNIERGTVNLTEETARAVPLIIKQFQRIHDKAKQDADLKPFTQSLGSSTPLATFAITYGTHTTSTPQFLLTSIEAPPGKSYPSYGTRLPAELLSELAEVARALPILKIQAQMQVKKKY